MDAPLKPCPELVHDLTARAYQQGYRDGREDAPSVFEPEAMREGCAQWQADNHAAISALATRPDPAPTGEVTQGDKWAGLDYIANFLNALDTEGMTASEVRSAVYSECLEPGCKSYLRSNAPLEAEIARLREALEPFARIADGIADYNDAEWLDSDEAPFQAGDFRRARLALSPDGDASEGGGL